MNWLLFISQLPTYPSSLRVNVWRKLRAAGALGLQNGVWVLPDRTEETAFLEDLLSMICEQNASGQIFRVVPFNEAIEKDILARFNADREEEYEEFNEHAQQFLAEIETETKRQKFTFAELEENEQDLQRLATWLDKIRKRDFMDGLEARKAVENMKACQSTFDSFAAEIYNRQTSESDKDMDIDQQVG